MSTPSLLRLEEHKALSGVTLSGRVLDLGGVRDSSYLRAFKGNFSVTTLNMDAKAAPDIFHDLESPLSIRDGEYDHVLLINVLEHVFEYRALLEEMARVLKEDGSVVVIAPFIYPYHPSPRDYHRFTGDALRRELEKAGFASVEEVPLGGGMFSAGYLFADRLLPSSLRLFNFYTFRYLILLLDGSMRIAARALGKKYSPADYALGYCAVARK